MDEKLYKATFDVYLKALVVHFVSKPLDYPLHKFSEQVYTETFEFAHKIAERLSDLNKPIDNRDVDKLKNDLYDSLWELLKLVNQPIWENKPTIWADNLLRGLADTAEDLYGSARAFVKRDDKEIQAELEKDEILNTIFKDDDSSK